MKPIKELDLKFIMPYPRCPNCGSQQLLSSLTYGWYKGDVKCPDCKCTYHVEFGGIDGESLEESPKIVETPEKIDPKLLEGLMVPTVPKELYSVYKDAAKCLGFGVPKGAAVLCRYVIQLALTLKDIPDNPAEKMVDIAAAKGLLSPSATKQCKAVVFMGGKGGHPQANWVENVTPDDAHQSLLATKRVLLELFYPDGLR